MAEDRIDGIGGERAAGKSRAQRLVEMFQRKSAPEAEDQKQSALSQVATSVQSLAKQPAAGWSSHAVQHLAKLVQAALAEESKKAEAASPNNPHALALAVENARSQMRQLATSLQPPPEIVDGPEFLALMELLKPAAAKLAKTGFERETMMRGKVRADVLNRQVQEAVNEADRIAAKKRVHAAEKANVDTAAIAHATRSLMAMSRLLQKRRKKKAAAAGEAAEVGEAAEITKEEAEELAALGLDIMRVLREELAPRWAPAQQPWFVNSADNEVYNIILAAIPRELFEETQAFGQMQSLRGGDEVFTLRAADRTADAVSRK